MEGTSFEEDWAVVVAAAPALRRALSRSHGGVGRAGPVFAELDALKRRPARVRWGCWTRG